jgi:hypothetical protein
MSEFVLLLRSGSFVTRGRVLLLSAGMALGYILTIIVLGVTAHGLNDYAGRPLGTDFSNVYAAGVAALQGDATIPFDISRQVEMERQLFGPATTAYGWHYPPFFLFVAMALAKFPYLVALVLWQAGGLLIWLGAMKLLLSKSSATQCVQGREWLVAALGFTAVFTNLTHGQNGFLTTALVAAGLAVLDERPVLAGILFGLLCYKPQFAVVIPLVLAATARWRSLGAMAVTGLFLAIAATAAFGWSIWPAFADSMHFIRSVALEQGNIGFYKIQSLFAFVRSVGGSVTLAYAAQILLALLLVGALIRIWRGPAAPQDKKSALCLAALLITPYCLDYDMVLLAPVIALSVTRGKAKGFAPYEILSLVLLWLAPGMTRGLAQHAFVPLGMIAMLFSFALIWRRTQRERKGRPHRVNEISTPEESQPVLG